MILEKRITKLFFMGLIKLQAILLGILATAAWNEVVGKRTGVLWLGAMLAHSAAEKE